MLEIGEVARRQLKRGDVTLYRMAAVGGRPVLPELEPHQLPRDRFWFVEAFRRPVNADDKRFVIVHERNEVLGLAQVPAGFKLTTETMAMLIEGLGEAPKGRQAIRALITSHGQILSASIHDPKTEVKLAMEQMVHDKRPRLVEGWYIEVEELTGDEGRKDYLATMRPVGRLAIPRFADLTTTQIRICELAGLGYQAKEIAHQLGNQTNTIRWHLREAYKRLAVASRVELVAVIEEWDAWILALAPVAGGPR